MERESAEKVIFEMETQKNSQFVAASLGRGLHKLLIVVGSDGLESSIGVRLAQIPTDSCIVSDTQSAINMCPSQIWKPRFPNVKIREKGIELPEGTKVTRRVTFAVLICQFFSEVVLTAVGEMRICGLL